MPGELIIGVTGTFRSGKDTIAKYLTEEKGFIHHSLSDILRDEAKERGLEQIRDNWVKLGNEIREEYGVGELSKRLLKKIKDNQEKLTVVSSIRNPGEIEAFRQAADVFFLVAVDAPIKLRYDRAQAVGNLADKVSFSEFKAQEEKEMATSGAGQQLGVCMSMADYTIVNDGNIDKLNEQIENILSKINNESKN